MQRTEKNQIGPKQKTGGLGRDIEGSTSKVQGCGLQHRQENRITFLWYLSWQLCQPPGMLADMGLLPASKNSMQRSRGKKHFLPLLLCLCLSLHPTLTFSSLESKIKDQHSGKQLSWRFTQAQDIIPISRSQTPSQWLPAWCRLPKNIKAKMSRAHGCFSSGGISWCFSTCLVTDIKTEPLTLQHPRSSAALS